MSEEKSNWIPEILYEEAEEGGLSSHIPFIQVPESEEMPKMLFVFESRETGEFEPGPNGEELPVTELDLYQYANMNYLKQSPRGTWPYRRRPSPSSRRPTRPTPTAIPAAAIPALPRPSGPPKLT